MHPTFFAVKRVYWRTIATTRPLVKPFDLTPARFDLMRIVVHHAEGIAQGTIQWLLGVSAPVVSRMVKALVRLGFLSRYRGVDRRCAIIELTPMGRETLRKAMAATVDNQVAEKVTSRAVLGERARRVSPASADSTGESTIERARPARAALDALLAKMRFALVDPAPFVHPWRSGDFVPLVMPGPYEIRPPDPAPDPHPPT